MQHHHPGTSRTLPRLLLGALLVSTTIAGLSGCSPRRQDPAATGRTAAGESEWKWLRSAKQALDGRRAQLAQLRTANARSAAAPPAVAASMAALEKEVAARSDELGRRLVDFINSDPPVEGEKLAGRRLEAVRMKSDEDIAAAHEFIERGGDYRRALEIYEAALAVDPDNPRLQQELASARSRRYMTAERFGQAEKGMTLDQVRDLLGQPNLRDVREFPDRGIVAWFYARDAAGRAAAVWFARDNGVFTVYLADFHAIEIPEAAGLPPASPPQAPPAAAKPGA
jgi:tetratricopeptide (TPR) repeat protein